MTSKNSRQISELTGDLESKRSELALLRAGARAEEIDGKEKLVETKRVELANARRNQEQRNQLAETLERKRSELQLDQQNLARTQELVENGLIARADLEKAETAVKVSETGDRRDRSIDPSGFRNIGPRGGLEGAGAGRSGKRIATDEGREPSGTDPPGGSRR